MGITHHEPPSRLSLLLAVVLQLGLAAILIERRLAICSILIAVVLPNKQFIFEKEEITKMKFTAAVSALFIASASAFAPSSLSTPAVSFIGTECS